MNKQTNLVLRRICVLLGFCMIVAAVLIPLLWQWNVQTAAQKMDSCVRSLRMLLPEPQPAYPQSRRDNTMPILSFDGVDYVGILEIPRYGSALAVGADWGKVSQRPCRLSGSIYDHTMQIGGTAQEGQYSFYRELSVGDDVYFTDMEGNRYTYTITDIRFEKHADQAALHCKEGALTLFIKNMLSFGYIIVFCSPAG